jgi:hypothetical protein
MQSGYRFSSGVGHCLPSLENGLVSKETVHPFADQAQFCIDSLHTITVPAGIPHSGE